MKKMVIEIYGVGEVGKSNSVIRISEKIKKLKKTKTTTYKFNGSTSELHEILENSSIKIGLDAQGDPGTNLKKRIQSLVAEKCDIIICTCRTYGKTVEAIETSCNKYQIIWVKKCAIYSDIDEKHLRKMDNKNTANIAIKTIKKHYQVT